MKKWNKILSVVCAVVIAVTTNITTLAAPNTSPQKYEITVGNSAVSFNEGEKIVFGMEAVESATPLTRAGSQTVTGNVGTLTVWGSGSYFYWDIKLTVPASSFVGFVDATDITSGFSCGLTSISGFGGKCMCVSIRGHIYRATLFGTAYLGFIKVAKAGWNSVSWIA